MVLSARGLLGIDGPGYKSPSTPPRRIILCYRNFHYQRSRMTLPNSTWFDIRRAWLHQRYVEDFSHSTAFSRGGAVAFEQPGEPRAINSSAAPSSRRTLPWSEPRGDTIQHRIAAVLRRNSPCEWSDLSCRTGLRFAPWVWSAADGTSSGSFISALMEVAAFSTSVETSRVLGDTHSRTARAFRKCKTLTLSSQNSSLQGPMRSEGLGPTGV